MLVSGIDFDFGLGIDFDLVLDTASDSGLSIELEVGLGSRIAATISPLHFRPITQPLSSPSMAAIAALLDVQVRV